MKKHNTYIASVLIALSLFHVSCGKSSKTPSHIVSPDIPVAIERWEDLYQAGSYYFGGQPDEEMLHWLADQEVDVVINLRTHKEMETHAKENFNEESSSIVIAMFISVFGLEYLSTIINELKGTLCIDSHSRDVS